MLSLVTPIQWLSDLSIVDYRTGIINLPIWSDTDVYTKGDMVIWLDGSVYEALEYANVGESPIYTPNKWYKVLDTYVGAEERVLFDGQTTILEYALNIFMGTTFVQPDYLNPTNRSDVYINNLDTDDNSFLVGESSPDTSFVATDTYLLDDFVGEDFNSNSINFTVFYPVTFTTSQIQRLRSYTEKYKLYGTTPNYVAY